MKKEIFKKVMVLGVIMIAILFMLGQMNVYAASDLNEDLENGDISLEDDDTLSNNEDDDVDANNELTLPENNEEDTNIVITPSNNENSDITLTTNNTNSNAEELPYTGTVSDTVIISAVVVLIAFGVYTLKKANDYKNI